MRTRHAALRCNVVCNDALRQDVCLEFLHALATSLRHRVSRLQIRNTVHPTLQAPAVDGAQSRACIFRTALQVFDGSTQGLALRSPDVKNHQPVIVTPYSALLLQCTCILLCNESGHLFLQLRAEWKIRLPIR
eukprot:745491-Rhodomonas_salina.1